MRRWLAAAGLVGLTACSAAGQTEAKVTKSGLEQELRVALPVGSSVESVSAYLEQRKIEHSALHSHAGSAHMGLNPQESSIAAIIRDTRRVFPVSYSLTMTFVFGHDRKLRSIEVTEAGTGP